MVAADPLAFTADQVRLMLLLLVPLGVVPGLMVLRHARGNELEDHPAAWALLTVFTSLVGVVAYWEHVRIQAKRAREADAEAGEVEAEAGAGAAEGASEDPPDDPRP